MTEQVKPFDAQRIDDVADQFCHSGEAAVGNRLARAAVAGQVDRHDTPVAGERWLDERPVFRVAAEPVKQNDGQPVAVAGGCHVNCQSVYRDGLGCDRSGVAAFASLDRIGRTVAGDEGFDVGIRDRVAGHHANQFADFACRTLCGDDPAQGSGFVCFVDAGQLGRLDFGDFSTLFHCLVLAAQPRNDGAFRH